MMKRILYLIIPLLVFILSCDDKKDDDAVDFSYRAIIDKEYRFDVGRIIPITISQAVETDGDISRDGNYFFYSSNSDAGNFDIYLRSMTDITTVRLTSHPARDAMPAISPDGKRLAFVSFRDNPEGDVFVLRIDSAKLISEAKKSVSSLSSSDNKVKNITIERDKDSGVVINIKNSSPAWSPDSKYIAYSSMKDGIANIWIMESSGSNKRRLTEKGGDYPSFSPDGSAIVFVSYRDNANGEIYTIDVANGSENRITSDKSIKLNSSFIKLNPSFMEDTSKIIYSSIEKDTNGNGILDIQDRAIIRFIDLNNELTYPLTKKSDSSFKAKWLPVLNTREYNGIIIYNDIIGENISLNIIPETGIIPKRSNAKLQYELCDSFITEYDDVEKYLLALEFVYNIYGRNSDNTSRVYVNRALEEAAIYYTNNKNKDEAERIVSIIKKRSGEKDNYASFILSIIDKPFNVKGTNDLVAIIKKFELENNKGYYIPFAIEDIANTYFKKNDYSSALKIYNYIADNYSSFERILDIHTKISLCSDDLRKNTLSDSAVKIFSSGNENQRILIVKNLIAPFANSRIRPADIDTYIKKISAYKGSFEDNKKILAVLCHIVGLLYDIKGLTDNSKEELVQSITLSHPNDFASYLSNIKLGDIERRQSRFVEAEKYYNAGISRYLRRFKIEDFKEKFLWLINYYEQLGERNELSGNFKDATDTYKKLIDIIAPIFNQRLYLEVYSEFAPRAHIQYIDAYTSWKGESSIMELEDNYDKNLSVYRMGFNRAAIYGFGYIYTKKALYLKSLAIENEDDDQLADVYQAFKTADTHIDWALFMNDGFIEAYILKSWIYQYIDEDRNNAYEKTEKYTNKYFERYLWEQNIVILEKALTMNDEKGHPDNEGDLHLNMGNNYFLLLNYPSALKSYRLAEKYKRNFGSDIEKAIFHFHVGYTYWQNNEIKQAYNEINKAHDIYNSLSQISGAAKYKEQYIILYRYFALFSRYEGKFPEAIDWYKKILDFAAKNKLTIDRARYYQEIASCYMSMKDNDNARAYLYQASTLLDKYPDDERKYNFKLKMFNFGSFYLGPFAVYNAGPDMAVIGDNKIFYPLDTQSKKLLNLSMLEEIAIAEGDYNEAIKNLNKKIAILEKSSTSVSIDSRIRSLNNLGYYSYLSGKTGDAEKYFNQATDLSKKNDNLQGTFVSMTNIVDLYAMAAEEGLNTDKDWENKTNTLIGKIDEYKKNYYKLRLDEEKEILNQKAKAKNEEVTQQQIAEITEQVEQEAQSKYYLLDISSATLKFYLAEYLYASDPTLDGKSLKKDKDLYSLNRDVYNLYGDALSSFEMAIVEAEKYGNNELKAKLLLNTAICYERTGDIEKAYVTFIDAKNLCEQGYLNWIKINVYHRLGNFINTHGAEIERGNYPNLADSYFASSISGIEEHPILYSSYSNRVRIIYNDYIDFLINRGDGANAFKVSAKYAQTARIISINLLSPRFSNEYDRRKYYEYSSELGKLSALRSNLSSILLGGADPLSQEVAAAKRNISVQEGNIKSLINDVTGNNSSIKNYIALPAYKIPTINNNIFKFHKTEKGNYYWKISKGTISSGYIKDDPASMLNNGTPIIILLNTTVVDMINSGSLVSSEKYIFINTLDRVQDYLTDSNNITGDIYSDEKGVGRGLGGTININEAKEGSENSFRDYSLIIDKEGVGNDISPDILFSSSISPACIIKSGVNIDYQYLMSFMEGALYVGTKRVIVSSSKDTVLPILRMLYGRPDRAYNSPFYALGYIDTFNSEKNLAGRNIQGSEKTLFNEYMLRCDFERAAVHLSRLYPLEKDRDSSEYIKNIWLIKLLSGDSQGSFASLNSYNPKDDIEKSAMMLRKVYTHIYFGDIKNADIEMNKLAGTDNLQEDMEIINSLIRLIKDNDISAIDVLTKIKKPYNTIIPIERYFIIAAKFLFMTDNDNTAKISSLIPGTSYLSEDEYIMRYIISGIKPPVGRSIRFDKIVGLWSISDLASLRDEAFKLIRGESGEDSLSPFPVIETILKHKNREMNYELMQFIELGNLSNIISKSDNLTSLILLTMIDDIFSEEERYQDRVAILDNILNIASLNSFNSIRNETYYDSALNYFLMEDFQESFNRAIAGEKLIVPNDRIYADMELLLMMLYIKGGKYKDAELKGDIVAAIDGLSPDRKYILNLQLSLIELNRLSSLKSASISDAAQFEQLFSTTVTLARHDTELLNHKGYRKITELVFDEFINYKMRTGQHTDAHYYNEMKKVLIGSSKCGANMFKYSSAIDMDAIQGVIPNNGVYVNIAKNRNDIFVWAVDKKSKNAFIIENGYASLTKPLDEYNLNLDSGKDAAAISKEFTTILSQSYMFMKDRDVILISPDSDTERIPFEILGEENFLSNKSSIIYIPSLLITTAESNLFAAEVYLPESDSSAIAYLTKVAIRESGIKYNTKSSSKNGVIHLYSKFTYNQSKRNFTFNNKDIKSYANNCGLFVASSDAIDGASVTDFLVFGRDLNIKAALLNSSRVQDINSAMFTEEFYRNFNKGISIQESFALALNKVKNSKYSHPMNWSGYRLNVYDLNIVR